MSDQAKTIQIAVVSHDNNIQTQCNYTLFALRSDGTIWFIGDVDIHRGRPFQEVVFNSSVVVDAPLVGMEGQIFP